MRIQVIGENVWSAAQLQTSCSSAADHTLSPTTMVLRSLLRFKTGLFIGVHDQLGFRFVRGERFRFLISAQAFDDSFDYFVFLRDCPNAIRNAGIKSRDDRY